MWLRYRCREKPNHISLTLGSCAGLEPKAAKIEQLKVGMPQTNIFWMEVPAAACAPLRQALERAGIRATVGPKMRLVTHLDISNADVKRTVEVFTAFFADWRV